MKDRWLGVDEVCEYVGISRDTVYKWIDEKEFPGYRVGRLWRFKAEEVDQWIRKSNGPGSSTRKPLRQHAT